MMDNSVELKSRVDQFNTLSLPGQPFGMHMGTSYLVNDLWAALADVTRQRDDLAEEVMRLLNAQTLEAIQSGIDEALTEGAKP